MPRHQTSTPTPTPSPDSRWESTHISTLDIDLDMPPLSAIEQQEGDDDDDDDDDLPPPSKKFLEKKKMMKMKEKGTGKEMIRGMGKGEGKGDGEGKGEGSSKVGRRKVKAPSPILPPFPPPQPPRSFPPYSILSPLSPTTLTTYSPLPILCCDLAKKTYHPSSRFPEHSHIPSENITPLLNNFISFARETAYGRIIDITSQLENENRFLIVVQEVERPGPVNTAGAREMDMCAPRYFLPVILKGKGDGAHDNKNDHDNDLDMLTPESNTDNTKGDDKSATGIPKHTFSITSHTTQTIHTLTRSLIDMEDELDDQRLASSLLVQALTPAFARTYPWSDDPAVREREDEKVEWESGEGGFREWGVVEGEEEGGKEGNLGKLWDWMPVEGRRGRMDVKCLECGREWVLMVRERGLMI
ncbi:hypothetical protein ONS95_014955 [Cadophora gregata]|uniref:uncharacterized protein n=1 Tax=Cadophora gregata TaxID=51156 RepID=UPI0026DD9F40|nr:uncharacterized protein ONS95_014955 [Cadophora gregata]KAK0103155.1 hypothetical protein ONS96_005764 [Cadophora gregata f. sp. sojae]KAK0113259.1 hypothetical protein ONS95_014955 [Cadophora gregata]